MGALALFLVIAGGTAYAADTIGSSDVIDNSLASVDLKNNQVRSADVQSEGLTGADIADQSGVDTCILTNRIGQLCVRAENNHRSWFDALAHCANLDLRLPSLGEATELARTHDIPNVDQDEDFWTADRYISGSVLVADIESDIGAGGGYDTVTDLHETVCVTTPTN